MATFQITGPDGKRYRVQGENPAGAMSALRKMLDGGAPARGHANVPEYAPPGVEGYNPQTGEVERAPRSMGASFAHGAADTATFGFGDEIASGLGSLLTGTPREQVLSEMRGLQQDAQADNPGSYLTGQIAGGVAQGLATGPLTASSRFAGSTLLPRIGAGMADGAVFGGIYGAGSGTDASSRALEAAKSGGIGLAAGGLFPLVAHGVGKAYTGIRNHLAAQPIARDAGASPEALRMLGDVMASDGSLGPQGANNMARAGSEAMLVDAGPNARAVLDTAIQRGGPGSLAAREAIDGRVARGTRGLMDALDTTLGVPEGVNASQRSIRNASRPGINAAYERAYGTPIDYASEAGRRVEDIIGRIPDRIAGRAVRDAVDQMIYDGVPNAQIMAKIADDGSVTFQGMPNVMQADYIKKALDRIVSDGTDEMTGKLSGEAVFASRIARDLRDAVSEAVPAYREALDVAGDSLSRQSATRLGSKLLSPSMTRDQVAEAVKGMGTAERQALAQGLRSQIDDAMARVTRTVQDGDTGAREAIKGLRELSSRANREKLALAIGEEAASNLFGEVDQIATSFDLRASVADNSKTFARLATSERVRDVAGQGGAWSTAKRGEGLNATKRLIQAITGETDATIKGREDRVYTELAKLLTRQGGAERKVYEGINKLGQTDMATQMMRERIVRALTGPHLSYPLATQSPDRLPL